MKLQAARLKNKTSTSNHMEHIFTDIQITSRLASHTYFCFCHLEMKNNGIHTLKPRDVNPVHVWLILYLRKKIIKHNLIWTCTFSFVVLLLLPEWVKIHFITFLMIVAMVIQQKTHTFFKNPYFALLSPLTPPSAGRRQQTTCLHRLTPSDS